MEYNVFDRIVKFGDGLYRYDNRGLVVQNAREEKFQYSAKGLLVGSNYKNYKINVNNLSYSESETYRYHF